jgi:hypothetical protein
LQKLYINKLNWVYYNGNWSQSDLKEFIELNELTLILTPTTLVQKLIVTKELTTLFLIFNEKSKK